MINSAVNHFGVTMPAGEYIINLRLAIVDNSPNQQLSDMNQSGNAISITSEVKFGNHLNEILIFEGGSCNNNFTQTCKY